MQYIQFQPQIASQVPLPEAGNVNFFIDADTNSIASVDDNGNIITGTTTTQILNTNLSGFTVGANQPITSGDTILTAFQNVQAQLNNVTGGTGGAAYSEVTYSELVDKITGSTLTTGSYYMITDFKTCYDVPEYYVNGNAKGSDVIQYNQSSVEPIIVFATSTNTISSTAYQPLYPNDRIQYDWTWNITEISGGAAYGRITERVDEFNNRTDYDHRNIYFNRFKSYNKESQLTGTIASYNSSTGIIIGNDTLFLTEISNGDVLLTDGFGGFGVKVISAVTNTELSVVIDSSFGSQINFSGGLIAFYASSPTGNYYEYKEVYVGQKNLGDWDDKITFNLNGSNIHNYVGDYSKFYIEGTGSNSGFLLANNVFFGNNIYSNTIGDRSYNNTGTYWFSRNTIAGRFYNNVIYNNGFYSNSIGEYFDNNIIKGYMWKNTIEQYFEYNEIYHQFYDNQIGNSFYENNIYCEFYENTIKTNFEYNLIGDINDVYSYAFSQNTVEDGYQNNTIIADFYKNQVGVDFNNNDISGQTTNNIIGNQFEYNTIYNNFYNNQIFNEFKGNVLIGQFYFNKIDWGFSANQISGDCSANIFGSYTVNNDFLGDFGANICAGSFSFNVIDDGFFNNNIGFSFNDNIISPQFQNNEISTYFQYNTIGEGFGVGLGGSQKNYIGDNFQNNTIGEYFYNNRVGIDFYSNTIGNNFQWNVIDTNINGIDFTYYYGNITAFTYTAIGTGATDNIYTALTGLTTGNGVDATFNVEVSGGTVIGVSGNSEGKLYICGDTVTILGTLIGGSSNMIDGITSDGVGKTGTTNSYINIPATGGTGTNATFDIQVISNLVDSVIINNGGTGYSVSDNLVIVGSLFGGTDGVDDITVTVTAIQSDDIVISVSAVSPNPSVYRTYTCNIFERAGGDKRLSYYDESDVLTITDINV